MKIGYRIGFLLMLTGCSSGLDSDDFEKHLSSLNKANAKILALNNLDTLNNSNSLNIVTNILKNDTVEFHDLRKNLLLRDIKYYNLGGIEYYFGTETKGDYAYYMLYTINPDKKNEFTGYEQYVDFQLKRKNIDQQWTFIKKREIN